MSNLPSTLDTLHLRIDYLPPGELRAAERRPRTHSTNQQRKLDEAIKRFGFVAPILIDERRTIIDGHARWEAAVRLGVSQAPVIAVGHLSAAERKALSLALNRIAEEAGWDREILALEFKDIVELDPTLDLSLTGFDAPEIDIMFLGGDDDGLGVPGPSGVPVSRPGDIWVLDRHRVVCGDSTDAETLRRAVADETASMIFTDPPYNVAIQGHVRTTGASREFAMASGEMTAEEFTEFLSRFAVASSAWLKPGGLAYVCMDWRHMSEVAAAAEAAKWSLLNLCVWDKGAAGMGSFYRSQHELVFVYRSSGAKHNNRIQLGVNGRNRSNVWSYPGLNQGGSYRSGTLAMHPTVKPISMIRDAVLDCTERGELVLDPFGGSGATLLAAHRSDRRCAMVEIDPLYVDLIIRRWEAESGSCAVRESDGARFGEVERLARTAGAANGVDAGAGANAASAGRGLGPDGTAEIESSRRGSRRSSQGTQMPGQELLGQGQGASAQDPGSMPVANRRVGVAATPSTPEGVRPPRTRVRHVSSGAGARLGVALPPATGADAGGAGGEVQG